MGFLPNHERAPERDLPRKRGFPRFLELLARDFWKYFKAEIGRASWRERVYVLV